MAWMGLVSRLKAQLFVSHGMRPSGHAFQKEYEMTLNVQYIDPVVEHVHQKQKLVL